jgi:hypothetical protein
MTLAEFLQKLLSTLKTPDVSVSFAFTQIIGDPALLQYGEVWATSGDLTLSSDGESFEATAVLSPIFPSTSPSPYQVTLSLNVNLGTLTIQHTNGLGGIHAYHLQLSYFNGVLYGSATHFAIIGPPFHFEILPGSVFTLTFTTTELIPA